LFADEVPGARLYLHTAVSQDYGGVDVEALVKDLGLEGRVIYPDWYRYWLGMPAEYLNCVYNAGDVYLGAAMAEGFGIPLIEAQACGLPVITTNFSAMPELVKWGALVEPRDRIWTQLNSWQAWPDVDQIAQALRELYQEQQDAGGEWPLEIRQDTSLAIHAEFGWDAVVERYWAPLVRSWAA
jgi:glycosyltransferase involved in cell wall biosynthesis